jgi:hypothetical protein
LLSKLYKKLKEYNVAILKGRKGTTLSTLLNNLEEGITLNYYKLVEELSIKKEFKFK